MCGFGISTGDRRPWGRESSPCLVAWTIFCPATLTSLRVNLLFQYGKALLITVDWLCPSLSFPLPKTGGASLSSWGEIAELRMTRTVLNRPPPGSAWLHLLALVCLLFLLNIALLPGHQLARLRTIFSCLGLQALNLNRDLSFSSSMFKKNVHIYLGTIFHCFHLDSGKSGWEISENTLNTYPKRTKLRYLLNWILRGI